VSEQLALFERVRPEPEGLRYAADFVSSAIEKELISAIRTLPLRAFQSGEFEGKRRVASVSATITTCDECSGQNRFPPGWRKSLQGSRHSATLQFGSSRFCASDTAWGRDRLAPRQATVCGEFGLSLGASCKFRFRSSGKRWDRFTLDAEPRSFYMMSGASRQNWEQSIFAVEALRYSLTFRPLRHGTWTACLIAFRSNMDL
jgi:hypothetical protein